MLRKVSLTLQQPRGVPDAEHTQTAFPTLRAGSTLPCSVCCFLSPQVDCRLQQLTRSAMLGLLKAAATHQLSCEDNCLHKARKHSCVTVHSLGARPFQKEEPLQTCHQAQAGTRTVVAALSLEQFLQREGSAQDWCWKARLIHSPG